MLSAATISNAVFSLILVICLILISAYLLRTWRNYRASLVPGKIRVFKTFISPAHGAQVEILETRPIDFKRKLVLIRRGQAFHLLLCGEERDIVIETGILDDTNERSTDNI